MEDRNVKIGLQREMYSGEEELKAAQKERG